VRKERIFLMGICLALLGIISFATASFSEHLQPNFQLTSVQKEGFYAIGAIFIAMCALCVASMKGSK